MRTHARLATLSALLVTASVVAGCSSGGEDGPQRTSGNHWQPAAGTTWQWQLMGPIDQAQPVQVYDVDWEVDPSVVASLHAAGKKVICYVSVGAWEDWRPDAANVTSAVIGADYAGWPGEKYLDIRAAEVRAFTAARFDVCKAKGFDAIEPDNMDVFELGAASGFPLTEADGLAYARWLAGEAHARGLGIGQKNASVLTADLLATYDWALSESCWADGWCADLEPYVAAGKPVFMCEYGTDLAAFAAACAWGVPRRFSPILKSLGLDAPVTYCP